MCTAKVQISFRKCSLIRIVGACLQNHFSTRNFIDSNTDSTFTVADSNSF